MNRVDKEAIPRTIFDLHMAGRNAVSFSLDDGIEPDLHDIPKKFLREEPVPLPDVPEVELIRHYIALSRKNYGVDNGIYPLGSCTMKYNPKVHEALAGLEGFTGLHPLQPFQSATQDNVQGILKILHDTGTMLCELTGMDHVSLQPAAGAHGEFTGLLIIHDYLKARGELRARNKIIVPDTAHGTNPASAAACNFEIIELESGDDGLVNMEQLEFILSGGDVAGIMLTNPNTLGLFEKNILEITRKVHESGGLCYYDGANLNGLLGICRPGDMGFDIIHVNLHKTFSTPHGGGGPGAGPIGVKSFLADHVPGPRIVKDGEGRYRLEMPRGRTIKAFHGNVGVIIRAYCYMVGLGLEGLRKSAKHAVLNANYLKKRLEGTLHIPYPGECFHEFVANDEGFPNDVTTEDIAKRMLDLGVHAPTIYFPLIVHGAIMIEPTETESKKRLDGLVDIFEKIRKEAVENPQIVKEAPCTMPVGRLDQVGAAREPLLTVDALERLRVLPGE